MKVWNRIKYFGLIALLIAMITGCQTKKNEEKPAATAGTESQTETAEPAATETEAATAESTLQSEASTAARIFTDSAGREVEIPAVINTAAPSGQVAQLVLYTAVPDKMSAIAIDFRADAKAYIDEKYTQLPVLGQFYGKNANLNMEELIKVSPDVVVDIGEKKDGIAADMDQLQEQIGIPVIFIEATFETMDQTYEKLGELFGNEDEMQILSSYCKETVEHAKTAAAELTEDEKVRVYIAREEEGFGTDARGSFHAATLELIGAVNVADTEVTGSGGGSIVSPEQIINWNPEVILVYSEDIYNTIKSSEIWAGLEAVKNDRVYLIPSGPYNFISNPPSVNRMIGIHWLGQLLYPEQYVFDEETLVTFYENFYHVTPTAEQVDSLR